jgi:hypothetical protein
MSGVTLARWSIDRAMGLKRFPPPVPLCFAKPGVAR